MNRLSILIACFAALVVVRATEIQNLDADIEFIDDIEDFLAENPDVKLFALESEEIQPLGQIRYTLGSRIGGDRVVAQGNNNFNYPTIQDVRVNLNYPSSGIGAIVSFVEIVVDQTSSDGNAYIVGGGIGQRSIRVVVEARRTRRFSYRATFFGYN